MVMLICTILPSCKGKEQKQQDIMIGAAASLKPVMEKLQTMYQEKDKTVRLVFSFASSGTIEQQIRQGAPIDLFISASDLQMQSLAEDKLIIEDSKVDLVRNQVVLITPVDSKLELSGFKDVPEASAIAIGDPESVPAGKYACEVFEYYNIWNDINAIVTYAKDVTEVLAWVSSGNVDAGVVYATDAVTSKAVTVAAVAPEESHSKVVYPAALVTSTKQEAAARDFLDYLSSEDAGEVFSEYGFIPLD
jgi:molybdate transport system substrate-binding protein